MKESIKQGEGQFAVPVTKTPAVSDAFKPHCWGKMKWILKYPSGMEPPHAVCRCEHGSLKCKLLTRQTARYHCPQSDSELRLKEIDTPPPFTPIIHEL